MDEPGFSRMKWCMSVCVCVCELCSSVSVYEPIRIRYIFESKIEKKKQDKIVVAATASATRITRAKASTKMVSFFFFVAVAASVRFCCRFAAAESSCMGTNAVYACTSGASRWKVYRFLRSFVFFFVFFLSWPF